MRSLTLLIPIFLMLLLIACSESEEPVIQTETVIPCPMGELGYMTDGQTCDEEPERFVCEVLTHEGTSFLKGESWDWFPEACLEVDDRITYTNGRTEKDLIIKAKDHLIREEKVSSTCQQELITYICQQNEVFNITMQSDIFGDELIEFSLYTATYAFEEQTTGPNIDRLTFIQYPEGSNIPNFYFLRTLHETDYDFWGYTYHENLELEDETYDDVIEYKVAIPITAEPHIRFYIAKGIGILGFELYGVTWMKK